MGEGEASGGLKDVRVLKQTQMIGMGPKDRVAGRVGIGPVVPSIGEQRLGTALLQPDGEVVHRQIVLEKPQQPVVVVAEEQERARPCGDGFDHEVEGPAAVRSAIDDVAEEIDEKRKAGSSFEVVEPPQSRRKEIGLAVNITDGCDERTCV